MVIFSSTYAVPYVLARVPLARVPLTRVPTRAPAKVPSPGPGPVSRAQVPGPRLGSRARGPRKYICIYIYISLIGYSPHPTSPRAWAAADGAGWAGAWGDEWSGGGESLTVIFPCWMDT